MHVCRLLLLKKHALYIERFYLVLKISMNIVVPLMFVLSRETLWGKFGWLNASFQQYV